MKNLKDEFKAKFKKTEKKEEEPKMKGWSLKKKVIVGLGVLGTAAIGAIAYGKSKQEDPVNYVGNDEDEDDSDDYESDDEESEEAENDPKEDIEAQ